MVLSLPIRRRRQHTPEFEQRLTALCQPGTSVSAVALAHGINSNLLRRWINQYPACMPSKSVTVPSIPKMEEGEGRFLYLTQEQAADLIMELPPHLAAMTRFALATGLRRANVTGMEWRNIDINRRVAWVWAEDAKGKRNIPVPLNDDAIALLNEQRGQDKEFVFVYEGNPILNTTTAAWKKAILRAGIDPSFTFHGLRHTWASWHVMAGTPLDVLQKLGGWKSLDMVMKYSHLAPDYIASFAENSARSAQKPAQSLCNVVDLKR